MITNAKSRDEHDETGGGILADEMGMGKSLSILALVTKRLEDGRSWAHEQSQRPLDVGTMPKRYCSATLIVVSSAREFLHTPE